MTATVTRHDVSPAAERWFLRRRPAALVLTVALFVLAQLMDPGGYLSTDVGGKTATIEVIVADGPLNPDLGYWAEAYDPDGSLYPMWSTAKVGDAWVNATTLPMLYAAAPLWAIGGPRLAILIPVLGSVAAALAAWSLARRIGASHGAAGTAFWVIGLGSPATVYALDFWEHSLGLALIAWAVVGALDADTAGPIGLRAAGWSGLAISVAASMRQEALVYGFVIGLVIGVRWLLRRDVLRAVLHGTALAVGTGVGIAANALLERAVFGEAIRAARGSGTASAAGTDLTVRVEEAIITGISPMAGTGVEALGLALLLGGLLVALGLMADRDWGDQRVIVIGLGAIALLTALDFLIDGMRFVPGMLATTPLAGIALARGWQAGAIRAVTIIAVGALPIVFMTQFAGGASAQWGGRYILTTGLLLSVVAVVRFDAGRARRTMHAVATAGAVVTLVGVAWAAQRTHAFADVGRALVERPEPALVFHDPFLAREPGPLALDRPWLAAPTEELRAEAATVLDAAAIAEFAYVDYDLGRPVPEIPGFEMVDEAFLPLVNDLQVRVTTFQTTR